MHASCRQGQKKTEVQAEYATDWPCLGLGVWKAGAQSCLYSAFTFSDKSISLQAGGSGGGVGIISRHRAEWDSNQRLSPRTLAIRSLGISRGQQTYLKKPHPHKRNLIFLKVSFRVQRLTSQADPVAVKTFA